MNIRPARGTYTTRGKLKRIAVGFETQLFDRLSKIAQEEKTSVSELVSGMIELWLREE